LNLRPPGYEPGELPDCSTPRRGGEYSIGPVWFLIASAVVFFVAVVASSAFVFVRAREFLRQLGAFSEAASLSLESVSLGAARLSEGASAADVGPSIARLRASQARLNVLLAALSDVRASVGRITAIAPRK
jgi:hypothetical protein